MNQSATDPRLDTMRAPELFVVLTSADTTVQGISDVLGAHIDHQLSLERSGVLVAAGPWVREDGRVTGGMMIMRATSADQVEELMRSDPFVTAGLFEYEIRKWKLNEGRISLVVDLSGGTGRFD